MKNSILNESLLEENFYLNQYLEIKKLVPYNLHNELYENIVVKRSLKFMIPYDLIKMDKELVDTIELYKKLNKISDKFPHLSKLVIFDTLLGKCSDSVPSNVVSMFNIEDV